MDVLVADLDEAAAALGEQVPRDDEPVAQVGEVRVDAEFPGVAECLDLLDLEAGVFELAVLHVALAGADLPVRAELDAVGRVHVDHLDLAAQAPRARRVSAITWRLSPRIMRFDQLASCW